MMSAWVGGGDGGQPGLHLPLDPKYPKKTKRCKSKSNCVSRAAEMKNVGSAGRGRKCRMPHIPCCHTPFHAEAAPTNYCGSALRSPAAFARESSISHKRSISLASYQATQHSVHMEPLEEGIMRWCFVSILSRFDVDDTIRPGSLRPRLKNNTPQGAFLKPPSCATSGEKPLPSSLQDCLAGLCTILPLPRFFRDTICNCIRATSPADSPSTIDVSDVKFPGSLPSSCFARISIRKACVAIQVSSNPNSSKGVI